MIIIPDILEQFVNGLNLTFSPNTATFDGTNTTIGLDHILHTRQGLLVSITQPAGTNTFTVVSVSHDSKEIVIGGDVSDLTEITLPTVFFFHGTPWATNSHISHLDTISKYPMIYLYEIIRETFGDRESRGIEAEVKLFFLDEANFQDWTTDQHYSEVITGQRLLVEYFISESRKKKKYFSDDDGGSIYNHVKFGEYVDKRGHKSSIFNDRLSGVELNFRLTFNCCNC